MLPCLACKLFAAMTLVPLGILGRAILLVVSTAHLQYLPRPSGLILAIHHSIHLVAALLPLDTNSCAI